LNRAILILSARRRPVLIAQGPGAQARNPAVKEIKMKKALLALLLFSLALTGCVVEPGGGHAYRDGDHGEFHSGGGGWGR
jgi:hypothetical protein